MGKWHQPRQSWYPFPLPTTVCPGKMHVAHGRPIRVSAWHLVHGYFVFLSDQELLRTTEASPCCWPFFPQHEENSLDTEATQKKAEPGHGDTQDPNNITWTHESSYSNSQYPSQLLNQQISFFFNLSYFELGFGYFQPRILTNKMGIWKKDWKGMHQRIIVLGWRNYGSFPLHFLYCL